MKLNFMKPHIFKELHCYLFYVRLVLKCLHSPQNVHIFIFNKCPLRPIRPTTMQIANLALVETKRITLLVALAISLFHLFNLWAY
jgi:hypothetical protein